MTVIWRLAAYAGISYLLWSITLYLAWQMEMSTRFLHMTQWFWIISTTIILEANHQVAASKEAKRKRRRGWPGSPSASTRSTASMAL